MLQPDALGALRIQLVSKTYARWVAANRPVWRELYVKFGKPLRAIRNDRIEVLRQMSLEEENWRIMLGASIKHHRPRCAKWLVREVDNNEILVALAFADCARYDSLSLLRWIYTRYAESINKIDDVRRTTFLIATLNGRLRIAQWLAAQTDYDFRDRETINDAIICAELGKHPQVAHWLKYICPYRTLKPLIPVVP